MTTAVSQAPSRERAIRLGIGLLGGASLAIGAFMVLSPSAFFDAIGPFGNRNNHYIRDMATWQAAGGVGLIAAVTRPSWRRPALAVGGIQALLHFLNHVADVGKAHPKSAGVADVVSLGASVVLFAWLWFATEETGR